jgi:hypothetical protein
MKPDEINVAIRRVIQAFVTLLLLSLCALIIWAFATAGPMVSVYLFFGALCVVFVALWLCMFWELAGAVLTLCFGKWVGTKGEP